MIYVLCSIFLVVFILCSFIFFKMNKLKDYNRSLEICINNINDILDKKLELVNELLPKIKDKKISSFALKDDFSLYEKEYELFLVSFNINKYAKEHPRVRIQDKVHQLNVLEESIEGLKDFYNANVLNYNEIFLKPGFNKIFKFFKFSEYKSFKIRKLEEYEVFKN